MYGLTGQEIFCHYIFVLFGDKIGYRGVEIERHLNQDVYGCGMKTTFQARQVVGANVAARLQCAQRQTGSGPCGFQIDTDPPSHSRLPLRDLRSFSFGRRGRKNNPSGGHLDVAGSSVRWTLYNPDSHLCNGAMVRNDRQGGTRYDEALEMSEDWVWTWKRKP
jgi:hypothetical protein